MARDGKKTRRAEFRKNRAVRARHSDWTQQFQAHGFHDEAPPHKQHVSGKGNLTRQRTVHAAEQAGGGNSSGLLLEVDSATCLTGRVLSVHGLTSSVQAIGVSR